MLPGGLAPEDRGDAIAIPRRAAAKEDATQQPPARTGSTSSTS
jgi:hypothetical protein